MPKCILDVENMQLSADHSKKLKQTSQYLDKMSQKKASRLWYFMSVDHKWISDTHNKGSVVTRGR